MRLMKPALIAYYYLDFKDVTKRDIRGLLSSLVTQLGDDSDQCWSVLSQLYTSCGDGADQPSEAAIDASLEADGTREGKGRESARRHDTRERDAEKDS